MGYLGDTMHLCTKATYTVGQSVGYLGDTMHPCTKATYTVGQSVGYHGDTMHPCTKATYTVGQSVGYLGDTMHPCTKATYIHMYSETNPIQTPELRTLRPLGYTPLLWTHATGTKSFNMLSHSTSSTPEMRTPQYSAHTVLSGLKVSETEGLHCTYVHDPCEVLADAGSLCTPAVIIVHVRNPTE